MNTLIIFQFETGDSSVRYYDVPIIAKNCSMDKCKEIEDSIASFVEKMDEDLDYEDMVETVMNESGVEYGFSHDEMSFRFLYTMQI